MLFTKSPWETPYRIRHDPFKRWRLAGLTHLATTFLIRGAEVRSDDPDGYSFIVADPSVLVSILDGYGAAKPRLLAIDWEKLILVSSVWSYTYAEDGRNYLAYADSHGRLRACEHQQPDPLEARSKVIVWTHADSDLACLS